MPGGCICVNICHFLNRRLQTSCWSELCLLHLPRGHRHRHVICIYRGQNHTSAPQKDWCFEDSCATSFRSLTSLDMNVALPSLPSKFVLAVIPWNKRSLGGQESRWDIKGCLVMPFQLRSTVVGKLPIHSGLLSMKELEAVFTPQLGRIPNY